MSFPIVGMIIVSVVLVFQWDVAQSINLKFPPPSRQPVTYKVGDPKDWETSAKLGDWPNDKTFYVGDTLWFTYGWRLNVYMVNKTEYDDCETSKESRLWTSGNDTIKLGLKGWHYFMCNYPGSCEEGRKIKVNVL